VLPWGGSLKQGALQDSTYSAVLSKLLEGVGNPALLWPYVLRLLLLWLTCLVKPTLITSQAAGACCAASGALRLKN
jgi:hypothetical protein